MTYSIIIFFLLLNKTKTLIHPKRSPPFFFTSIIHTMSTRVKNHTSRSISVFNKPAKNRPESAKLGQSSSWMGRPNVEELIDVHDVPLTIDRRLLAIRSSRVTAILKKNPNEDLSKALRDMPGDCQTFEQVARFCHGYEPVLTPVNSVQIFCLAHYLGMTDAQSQGNLLPKVSAYIRDKIIPSWNDSIKAVRACECVLQLAADLGLIDALMESIVSKAVDDPFLLGVPMEPFQDKNELLVHDEDGEEVEEVKHYAQPGVRRSLFDRNWQFEDLTMLSVELYEPIMLGMIHNKVPSGYIASNLSEYVRKWVSPVISSSQIASRIQSKNVIEAVERMLPDEKALIPCTILFQMLRFADILEAGSVCKNGLELRIGKQLDLASVSDLLIPSQGYTKELQYDVGCVERMLKTFYSSFADANGPATGLMRVAVLMEDFLAEVASDIDLKLDTFVQLSELSATASSSSHRCSDGIYRAIDIYLDKHKYLTDAERDKACQVLDCQSMSSEAMEHAAQNQRLPLRIVVQAMFANQLKLRNVIAKELNGSKSDEKVDLGVAKIDENREIGMMESKVMELERECWMIRKEIESEIVNKGVGKKKENEKKSGGMRVWKEMKRKFGCMSSSNNSVVEKDCNYQVIKKKKVHPKQ